jgi:hypothetical protein
MSNLAAKSSISRWPWPWYTFIMKATSFSSVADLSHEQRSALESMVGRPLQSEDAVFLAVLQPNAEPTAEAKSRASAKLEQVFVQVDRIGREQGISADVADAAIDMAVEAVRSRAT